MNIAELLKSTDDVEGYSSQNTFTNKKFGKIHLYNKTVRTKPNSSIIEVSMMINASSEQVRFGRSFAKKTVAVHRAMVAIHGVEQKVVDGSTLADLIRTAHSEFANMKDEELIHMALIDSADKNKDSDEAKILPGKTIMTQGSLDVRKANPEVPTTKSDLSEQRYVIITDEISKDSEIRVWCSCSSYYWVFQFYNVENNVDIFMKAPDRYIPKTKRGWEAFQSNTPVRNPQRRPGVCKHIMLLLALLMDSNTIEGANGVKQQFKANIRRFREANYLSPTGYDKLVKSFKSDYRRLKQQRNINRTESAGYAQLHKTNSKHVGWNKKLKWNPNKGHWRG